MKFFLRVIGVIVVLAFIAGCVIYRDPLWVYDEQTRLHLWRSNVQSKYVVAGGNRLHYFEAVPPHGGPSIPLVLVHGLGSRGEDWSPLIPTLAASGFHVYAPDLLGFGRSAKPDIAYSISLEEGVLVDFMQAAGVPRADVGGWSMGGWVVAKLALDHPQMVERLVLYDSAGLIFKPAFPRNVFVPSDADGLQVLLALLTPNPPAMPPFVARAAIRRVQSESGVVQQMMDAMEGGRDVLDPRLASLDKPTLVMWGTEDRLIPMSIGQRMHQDIVGSVFEGIVGCGHLAPGDCSGAALRGTIEFLTAEPALRGGERYIPGTPDIAAKMPAEGLR